MFTRVPLGDILNIAKGGVSLSFFEDQADFQFTGAYILSPLEEASRDPLQNAGFIVTWLNNSGRVTSRVTSYSLRNSVDATSPRIPGTPRIGSPSVKTTPRLDVTPTPKLDTSASTTNAQDTPKTVNRTPSNRLSVTFSRATKGAIGFPSLLNLPSTMSSPVDDTAFAAFKLLPINPTRIRRAASTATVNSDHDYSVGLGDATNCKEATELIVDAIQRACGDLGNRDGPHGLKVEDADVVSLAEAQRMTSMYAKMEYGVKRLLWLGG